jgi:sec-independent protein translocase protein TatA
MRVSPTAVVLLVVFGMLLFGSKRLPGALRALGQSLRILKSEARALRTEGSGHRPEVQAPRTIKAAPGDPVAARRVEDRG